MFGQSKNVLQGPDIVEAMANFAMAVAADRTTVVTLSDINNRLSAELNTASAILVTALTANATLPASLTGGSGHGYGGCGFGGRGQR